MHTIAQNYPLHPTKSAQRKYYDFFMNLPLFIPDLTMSNQFAQLLDLYPISPYLKDRDSLVQWVHFIHNKINVKLGKPEVPLIAFLEQYKNQYTSIPEFHNIRWSKRWSILAIITIVIVMIFVATHKKPL
jgi:hypothetical protein